jgi:hypothetical protein
MEILGYYKPHNKTSFFPKRCLSTSGDIFHEPEFGAEGDEYIEKAFTISDGKWFAVWKGLVFRYNKGDENRLLEHFLDVYILKCDKADFDAYFDNVNNFTQLVGITYQDLLTILNDHKNSDKLSFAFKEFLSKPRP